MTTRWPLRTFPGSGSDHVRCAVWALTAAVILLPGQAHAYVGPGAGLTAIGTVLALLAAVMFAAIGFVWYPIKRLMGRRSSRADQNENEAEDLNDRGTRA